MNTTHEGVIAVIPCLNEEKYIRDVVLGALRYTDNVIVVDNGSKDATIYEADAAGATVVACRKRGMGATVNFGLAFALAMRARIIVCLDGDGQHDPGDVPRVTNSIRSGEGDLAIGSRVEDGTMPQYRRVGNKIIRWLCFFACGAGLADAQCGFRAMSREVAETVRTRDRGFGHVTELIIRARKAGYRTVEVPVNCIYHNDLRENSTANPVTHGIGVALRTIRWRIWEHLGV